ncbi:MAG: MOSC domain-containing protein [Dehalococcoidia bacterium]
MPEVVALYRYPVKGFTPEPRESLDVLASGRVAGDRVLAFRFGDAEPAPRTVEGDGWWPKAQMLVLMNTPGLARLSLRYDAEARRLSISHEGALLVEGGLEDADRVRIAAAVAEYARALPEQPDLDRPGRLPLQLIGDGVTARYQDGDIGRVSLHGRASLASLGEALDDGALDERRFRSNIGIDDLEAWAELEWGGRAVRIGGATFDVLRPAVRCLATHANPAEGVRDRDVMTTLVRTFGHESPQFGVMMLPREGGSIRLGDPVELLD